MVLGYLAFENRWSLVMSVGSTIFSRYVDVTNVVVHIPELTSLLNAKPEVLAEPVIAQPDKAVIWQHQTFNLLVRRSIAIPEYFGYYPAFLPELTQLELTTHCDVTSSPVCTQYLASSGDDITKPFATFAVVPPNLLDLPV